MNSFGTLKIARNGYIVMSAIFCILGIFLMINPEGSMKMICIIAGALFIADGIIKIIGYFSRDFYCLAFQFDLGFGILMIAIGISEVRDSATVSSYYLDEEDYISTLQQEDYMNLYDMTCRDCIYDKKLSSNIKACQAVARYYQAATLYKAYVLTGDNLPITRQVQQMEQYAAQTGNYSDYVEKINQLLELDSLHTGETATN